ncbi:MAG TPA: hypothetical protein VFP54_03875 [Acidimicrobiales bacterium]|nr:hypothetical protein [Acidimicrobiales bacterium]
MQEEPTTPPAGRRARYQLPPLSPLTLLGSAVALIIVVALVISLVGWSGEHSKAARLEAENALRASATKAAVTYGAAFGSYDYRNLHGPTSPWTVIENHATARFRSDYQKTSSVLQPTIISYKATAKATVPVSAVSSISPTKAVVLLSLTQTITNSSQKSGPQTQEFIVVMTMVRQKGQWLIAQVQANV